MHGRTLKEICLQFQRNVYGKKKNANKTTGIQDMRNKKTTLFIFNPCLNKQIIYCPSKIQITRHKVLPYLVLKISQNMPAKTK